MASKSTILDAPVADVAFDGQSSLELTSNARIAIWFAVLSTTVFSQIAINIGEFPASTDLFTYGVFTVYLLLTSFAGCNVIGVMAFLLATILACLQVFYSPALASWTSLLLLFVLYLPYHFRLRRGMDLRQVQDYAERVFITVVMGISLIAVLQLIAVNLSGVSQLTNIAFVLPDEIKGAGNYQFGREEGGIVKANGFFLREASTLSIVTALAILLEYFSRSRKYVIGILAAGLFSSVSGSGILMLFAGFMFPTSIRRLPHFLVVSGILVTLLVFASDIPALDPWLGRLSELQKEGSSGYARYVAPLEMVQRSFDQGTSAILFGNGAGSYLRTIGLLERKYEISDPSWAKLLFEYGIAGLLAVSAVFFARLYSGAMRTEICNAIFFAWITAANVMKPEFAFLIWVLTLVPQRDKDHLRIVLIIRCRAIVA